VLCRCGMMHGIFQAACRCHYFTRFWLSKPPREARSADLHFMIYLQTCKCWLTKRLGLQEYDRDLLETRQTNRQPNTPPAVQTRVPRRWIIVSKKYTWCSDRVTLSGLQDARIRKLRVKLKAMMEKATKSAKWPQHNLAFSQLIHPTRGESRTAQRLYSFMPVFGTAVLAWQSLTQ